MKFALPQVDAPASPTLSAPISKEIKGLQYSWTAKDRNEEGKKVETCIVRCLKIGDVMVYECEEIGDPTEINQPEKPQNPISDNRKPVIVSNDELRLRFFALLDEGKNWLEIKTILNKAVTYPVMRTWTNNPAGDANTTK